MDSTSSDIIISKMAEAFGGNEFDFATSEDIFNSLYVDSSTPSLIEYFSDGHSPKRKYLENDEQTTKRQKLNASMEKQFTFPSHDVDDHSSSDLVDILNKFRFEQAGANLSPSSTSSPLFDPISDCVDSFIDQLGTEANGVEVGNIANIRMSIETRESKSKPFLTSTDNLDQLGKFKKIVIDFADSLPSLLPHFQQLSITLRRKSLKEMGRYNANIGEAEIFFCLHPDCCTRIKSDVIAQSLNSCNQLTPSKYQCKNKERWQEREFSLEDIHQSQSPFSFCLKPEWKGAGFKSNWIKPVYVFEIALVNHNIATKCVLYSFDIELQPHKFESKQKKKLSNSL